LARGSGDHVDLARCLDTITLNWREVFDKKLEREARAWVEELRCNRNYWAHQKLASGRAERIHDTARLLLEAIPKAKVEAVALPPATRSEGKPRTEDFRREVLRRLQEAERGGAAFIKIRSGDIHRDLGGKNSNAMVCNAMRSLMTTADVLVEQPPSGQGGTFVVQYVLPRPVKC
jgi:5-methylcytosine-specific restriction protein A